MVTNPVKAIRGKCLDCCCGSVAEVKSCTATACALFPFRMGKNPYRQSREMTEQQKVELADRLSKARNARSATVEKTEVYDA